ncbi:Uncharacterised protein [uncultured archaeon]|nr:Uncharacterised protein [uncultured archaeon]
MSIDLVSHLSRVSLCLGSWAFQWGHFFSEMDRAAVFGPLPLSKKTRFLRIEPTAKQFLDTINSIKSDSLCANSARIDDTLVNFQRGAYIFTGVFVTLTSFQPRNLPESLGLFLMPSFYNKFPLQMLFMSPYELDSILDFPVTCTKIDDHHSIFFEIDQIG